MNKDFEKWAKGYSGFDGGNPEGKIWLCGIEWGGKSPKGIENIKELFREDVSQVPTGYDNHIRNMKYPQYNLKFMKIFASLNNIEFMKNNKYDKSVIEKFNNQEKFFTNESNYLKLNLLPFNFPNINESNWDEVYKDITGFQTKKEYILWSLNERFKMFQCMTKKYSPTLIITVGKTHFENYKNAFGYSNMNFIVEKFKCKSSKEYKYFYDIKNKRLIINIPFFSGRYGLNSNCLLIETGKIIKTLLENKNINIELGE